MAELKTKPTGDSVTAFLNKISDEGKRRDAFTVAEIMSAITKEKPKMWGTSIVGFGSYHYKYASGQEGDWPVVGFSPRKQNLTLYLMSGFGERAEMLSKLGKHKTSKSCLYINQLADVDLGVLRELMKAGLAYMDAKHPDE